MAVSVVQTKVVLPSANPFAGDGIADIVLDAAATPGNYLVVAFYVPASTRTVTSVTQGATGLSLLPGATQEGAQPHEQWAYGGVVGSASTAVQITLSSVLASGGFFVVWELTGQHASSPFEDRPEISEDTWPSEMPSSVAKSF